jgi:hypothetical protein
MMINFMVKMITPICERIKNLPSVKLNVRETVRTSEYILSYIAPQ